MPESTYSRKPHSIAYRLTQKCPPNTGNTSIVPELTYTGRLSKHLGFTDNFHTAHLSSMAASRILRINLDPEPYLDMWLVEFRIIIDPLKILGAGTSKSCDKVIYEIEIFGARWAVRSNELCNQTNSTMNLQESSNRLQKPAASKSYIVPKSIKILVKRTLWLKMDLSCDWTLELSGSSD